MAEALQKQLSDTSNLYIVNQLQVVAPAVAAYENAIGTFSNSSGALVIKEEAFENMKNDPEFEEYVLNRVRSLYSAKGLPVGSNNVCYEVIGGSPEEYLNNQYENARKLRAFLENRMRGTIDMSEVFGNTGVIAAATTAYEQAISFAKEY